MQNKQKNLFKFILPMFLLLGVLLASRLFMFNTNERAKADNVTPESLVVIPDEQALALGLDEANLENPCPGTYLDYGFKVVFDTLGGSPIPSSYTVNAGDSIEKPTEIPEKAGFTFLYWEYRSICDGINVEWDFENNVVVYDLILTAKYKENTSSDYTVKFNANGGGDNPPSQTVAEGGLAKRPADPSKPGYKFRGWFNGTTKWVFISDKVESDMTLIARYAKEDTPTPVTYTVKFNANGGGTNPPSQNVTEGGLAKRPADPSKPGYKFRGWFNGTTKWVFVSDKVESDMTLIARYVKEDTPAPVNYTATFNTNGGGDNPPNQILPAGSLLTKPADPYKSGYVFNGWFSSSLGRVWNFSNDTLTQNTNLEAHYNAVSEFEINFNTDGGTPTPLPQTVARNGYVSNPGNPTKEKFTFLGWYYFDNSAGDFVKWDFAKNTVNGNLTLLAKWEQNKKVYNVRFINPRPRYTDKKFDLIMTSQDIEEGQIITNPPETPRYEQLYYATNYFIKWYNEKTGEEWHMKYSTVTEDVTLRAHYVFGDKCYINIGRFDSGPGATFVDTTWTYFICSSGPNASVTSGYLRPKQTPTRPGYTFLHWEHEKYPGKIWEFGTYNSYVFCESDNTFKAVWRKNN